MDIACYTALSHFFDNPIDLFPVFSKKPNDI